MQAVLGKLAGDEIKAWLPTLTRRTLDLAISRLPEGERKRYLEEWQAHLMEIPGEFSRFIYSVDQVRAALAMAAIQRGASRSSVAHTLGRYVATRQRDIASRVNMTIVFVVWLDLARLAGCEPLSRFTFARRARYPHLYQIVRLSEDGARSPEGSGECPLWLSCLVHISVGLQILSWRWIRSANRKLLEP